MTIKEHDSLKFIVAPHIVEDLGLNLYTNLPRVLVEFVANAYDADSPHASITLDKARIDTERTILKKTWEAAKASAEHSKAPVTRLAKMTLPDDLFLEISDKGHGMTREDLATKFLVAGRRRRGREHDDLRSAGGRLLMGRKGLGKLAGFGVAKVVSVITRAKGERHATKITLKYDDLIDVSDTHEIPIEEQHLDDGGGIADHGTKIVLSGLLYEPMGARLTTIGHHAADHFAQIDQSEFQIILNGQVVSPPPRNLVYAYPEPAKDVKEVVQRSYQVEDGRVFYYQYRIRFVEDRQALPAKERGIRVYAHKRLAATPSLLSADTNMHGFRMTDYMDGIVYADFIDDQPEDYIATDRQSLRWESPLLMPMYEELSVAIKDACKERQKARDKEKQEQVKEDPFTQEKIEKAELTKREKKIAWKIASAVSTLHKQGFEDNGYKTQVTEVLEALGRGDLLTTLAKLASEDNPQFDRVVAEVTRLTHEQLDGFYRYAKGRIDGIEALKRIVKAVDFKATKNEKALHKLLKNCPWLINPTYFEFLTSDKTERTMFSLLEKELKIDAHVAATYDPSVSDEVKPGGQNERPDLVFLLGNDALNRLVIVELKAPNTPLYGDHYRQLQGYVRRAEKWLKQRNRGNLRVEGLLIGSHAPIDSRAEEVEWLEAEVQNTRNQGQCRVYGIDQVLDMAQNAHKELITLWTDNADQP